MVFEYILISVPNLPVTLATQLVEYIIDQCHHDTRLDDTDFLPLIKSKYREFPQVTRDSYTISGVQMLRKRELYSLAPIE